MLDVYGDREGLHSTRSPPGTNIKEAKRLLASLRFAQKVLLYQDSQEESCSDAQTWTAQVASNETHHTQNVWHDQVWGLEDPNRNKWVKATQILAITGLLLTYRHDVQTRPTRGNIKWFLQGVQTSSWQVPKMHVQGWDVQDMHGQKESNFHLWRI